MQNSEKNPEIAQNKAGGIDGGRDALRKEQTPQEARIQLVHDTIKKALPPRFANVSPDFEILKQMQKGKSFLLTGAVGTGKTHKLISVLYAHLFEKIAPLSNDESAPTIPEKHIKKHFMTVTEALRAIKDEFDHPKTEGIIDFMIRKEMVFLDDLGAEKASEWVKEQLYSIINERYNWMRPVLITTNLSIQEIANNYGDRFASRIVEMCEIIKFTGSDRRLKR